MLRSEANVRDTSVMMQKIFIGLIATIGSLFALVLLQPSDYRVTRTMVMSAPAATVFAQIDDFHRWQAWSPWAKRDPAAKASFDGWAFKSRRPSRLASARTSG